MLRLLRYGLDTASGPRGFDFWMALFASNCLVAVSWRWIWRELAESAFSNGVVGAVSLLLLMPWFEGIGGWWSPSPFCIGFTLV